MHNIKANRLLKIAEKIKLEDPGLAMELRSLAESVLNRPHKIRTVEASKSITKVLQEVIPKLEANYALVGGLAVHHYVPSRSTQDLDFAMVTSSVAEMKKLFPDGKMATLVFTVNIDGVDLDFLLSDDFPWNKEAIINSGESSMLGFPVKVVTPEYLVLYKMKASRGRDIDDIKALVKLDGVVEKAKHLIDKHMGQQDVEDFEQLILESDFDS